ncbi:MAG: gamma subclass chorismate mutase AroQ [Kordiimonadaceae bacterium]|nr:gamma subclass chorismate mutase AroQ [Kordiimonadaceae bacterium]MBO6567548.1 gamma subclass chorismate mutase AroQ [Kordiimonadaceae bacterium]MBO6963238.1 gamma subclass chorismate mutase AroQ [Kordiimonadaceae bacterium]
MANDQAKVAQLRGILEERLALMPLVARYKWHHSIPVEDLEREARIQSSTVDQAKQLGIKENRASQLVAAQMTAAKMIQNRLLATWQQSEYNQATLPPLQDLSKDIRPVISRLTADLLTVSKAVEGVLNQCEAHLNLQTNRMTSVTDKEWKVAVAGLKPNGLVCE